MEDEKRTLVFRGIALLIGGLFLYSINRYYAENFYLTKNLSFVIIGISIFIIGIALIKDYLNVRK